MEDIENVLSKIIEAAKGGQNGSALYALDRLALIRKLAEAEKRKITRRVAA